MHITAISVLASALLASSGWSGAEARHVGRPMNAGSHHAGNGARHGLGRRSESGESSSSEGGAAPVTTTRVTINNQKPQSLNTRVPPSTTTAAPRTTTLAAPESSDGSSSEGGDVVVQPPAPGPVTSQPPVRPTSTTTKAHEEVHTSTTTKAHEHVHTSTTTKEAKSSVTNPPKSKTKDEDPVTTPSLPSSSAKPSVTPAAEAAREGGSSGGGPGFNPAWAVAPAAVAGAAGLFLYRRRRANDANTMEWPEEGVQKNALYEDTATHENALYAADNLQG